MEKDHVSGVRGGSTVYDAIVTGAVALVLIVCTAYVFIHS
jgi:hypothetical protein